MRHWNHGVAKGVHGVYKAVFKEVVALDLHESDHENV
jgi:hypothetical protein